MFLVDNKLEGNAVVPEDFDPSIGPEVWVVKYFTDWVGYSEA